MKMNLSGIQLSVCILIFMISGSFQRLNEERTLSREKRFLLFGSSETLNVSDSKDFYFRIIFIPIFLDSNVRCGTNRVIESKQSELNDQP
jgi:hypothetical protein